MPNQSQHVVIAGAGPAGSTLAIRLRMLGLPVTLIERYKFPRAKLCGEFISPECLRHFGDLGVLDEMLAAGGDRVHETIFYETAGRHISVPSRWLDSGGFALSLSRARMDEILLNAARASGATVLEETSVIGLLKNGEAVRGVRARGNSGMREEIEANLTIDATGRARVLARLADKTAARRETKPKFVGLKAHFRGVKMPRGVCEIYALRGGYAGLSFVENDEANLCFLTRSSLINGKNGADRVFDKLIRENRRGGATLAKAKRLHDWIAVSVPAFGLSPFPEAEGLIAVGDSAAFVDPFTGSGMLLAMESAATLVECIAMEGTNKRTLKTRYRTKYYDRFSGRLGVSALIRHVAYEPLLSRLAVMTLSTSRTLRESLARRTRSTRPTENL